MANDAIPVAANEPAPLSKRTIQVPGGMCNVRLGHGAIFELGKNLIACTGKPRAALLVVQDNVSEELCEAVSRQLIDTGFSLAVRRIAGGPSVRSFDGCQELMEALSQEKITADDALVGVGDADVLSACCFVSGLWCGGVTCAFVATDLACVVETTSTPRGMNLHEMTSPLSIGADEQLIACKSYARLLMVDLDHLSLEGEPARFARALMVGAAVADSERALGALSSRASSIAACDIDETGAQLLDTLRSRGRLACSKALHIRQGLRYGRTFECALARLAPEIPRSSGLAEGLRFASRVAVGVVDDPDIDLVFAQDALLDRMGIGETPCTIDPAELVAALKDVCLRTSNRFMLAVPQAIGKVRLAVVPDEVLMEHAEAWCYARARRAARERRSKEESS